jgi:hypothetical protein
VLTFCSQPDGLKNSKAACPFFISSARRPVDFLPLATGISAAALPPGFLPGFLPGFFLALAVTAFFVFSSVFFFSPGFRPVVFSALASRTFLGPGLAALLAFGLTGFLAGFFGGVSATASGFFSFLTFLTVRGVQDKPPSLRKWGQSGDKTPRDYQNRKEAKASIFLFSNKIWCLGPESNRYSHEDRGILSPLRLPIPPPRHLAG